MALALWATDHLRVHLWWVQTSRKPCSWPDVCTELSKKHGKEDLNAFVQNLYNKYRDLSDALKGYGTLESSGSWKRDGDERKEMVRIARPGYCVAVQELYLSQCSLIVAG